MSFSTVVCTYDCILILPEAELWDLKQKIHSREDPVRCIRNVIDKIVTITNPTVLEAMKLINHFHV